MGIGDEIMVTGRVRALVANCPKARVGILDMRKFGRMRWHDIWRDNPNIAAPGVAFKLSLYDHGGNRPYIVAREPHRFVWRAAPPFPGRIYGLENYLEYTNAARGHVIIQNQLKPGASVNKNWMLEYWHRLVREYPTVKWLQIGNSDIEPKRRLPIPFLHTPDFRAAVAALKGARAAVLQEGGLHHAAAAMDTPAVVLFGGFISPKCTGYAMHRNLFLETEQHPLGCGTRAACLHCERAMRDFTPLRVFKELEKLL